MGEKGPTSDAPPADETEIVAKLHDKHDRVLGGSIPMSEMLLSEIRADLSRLESYPMYREYIAGVVPTIPMLAQGAQRAVEAIDALVAEDRSQGKTAEDLAEELKIRNLLAGRANSIRRSVAAYIQTVIRFNNLKRLSHGGSRDTTEQFVRADESRRRAHNSLLQSLRVMTATARQAEREGLLPKNRVVEWAHGMHAKTIIEQAGTILVFSEQILQNERDYIKDWAIAADFDEQLGDMAAAQKKEE